jgi:hypothetical protein
MTTVLPDLWTDWCSVTGHSAAEVDDSALTSFVRQARPPQTVLGVLRRLRGITAAPKDAPAWPPALRSDPESLHRLLLTTGSMTVDPGLHWISRLRLLRLRFAAVLLSPRVQGGLGLDRSSAAALTPRQLEDSRPAVGNADNMLSCPACAITAWLDVLSANSTWSRLGVRELAASGTASAPTNHQHEPSNSAWTDWPEHPNLLPAIDRWGYLDRYGSLHRSSLSVLIASFEHLMTQAPLEHPGLSPEPLRQPTRRFTADEVEDVLARADELNARISGIIAELG